MGKKIMIVDDDKDLVESLTKVFSGNGYTVAAAHSSSEGLKTVLKEKPDLIILDVTMETDTAGFEFAYQIRNKRETSRYKSIREVPIILLTAIAQVTNSRFSLNDKESFLPSVNDFINKPVKIDDLLAKVKRFI